MGTLFIFGWGFGLGLENNLVKKMEDLSTAAHQEPYYENEETEPKLVRTDADTVKELVEMKFLTQRRNIRLRTPTRRFFSRNHQVLIDNDTNSTTHAIENV